MSSGSINSGSLIGALIAQKDNFTDGIRYAQSKIDGTMSLIILTKDGIIAARDQYGRLPIIVGKEATDTAYPSSHSHSRSSATAHIKSFVPAK